MIKNNLFNSSAFFHLNFECEHSGWFKELEWIRHCRAINGLAAAHKIECIAYVMMDTHSHMLLRSVDRQENYFSEAVAKALKPDSAEPEFLEPITNTSQFLNSYKYIYRNPVDAGLTRTCETYPFSTLHSLLGRSPQRLIAWDYMNVIQNPIRVLNWLNSSDKQFTEKTW